MSQRAIDSMRARLVRWLFNVYPPYWATGIRVAEIAPDFRRIRVEMALRFYNRNYVGTHFGGNLYGMTDPFLMIMLMQNLGRRYQVWDSEATIAFVRPGTGRVAAVFELSGERLAEIKARAAGGDKTFHDFDTAISNEDGETVAKVKKTIYVRLMRDHRPPAPPA